MYQSAVTSLVFVLSATAAQPAGAPASSSVAVQAIFDAAGAATQADGPRMAEILTRVPARDFAGTEETLRACMLERLGSNVSEVAAPDIEDPFVRQVLEAYRTYWRAAFARAADRTRAEASLLNDLRRLLGRPDAASMSAIEPLLIARLKKADYHSIAGVTQPLREFMLWRKQEARQYEVQLPEGNHRTTVELLDDFASFGWSNYMSCGKRSTGGWATTNALYAVVSRYESLDSEEFRVTFLGHETQHFADLNRFLKIEPWELEYRAKLTELAQAYQTKDKVLLKFVQSQGDDPSSPHAYANKRVLAGLRRRLELPADADLTQADVGLLQAAAVAELRADTARREGGSVSAAAKSY